MGRPYSQDLRERVVAAAAVSSRRQAATRFKVGIATATRWMAAVETSGTLAARPQGRPRTSKLDPHEAFLRGLIDAKVDITLEEMRARLREEHGLLVGLSTLWRFLDARDLTYKKDSPRRRAGACGCESGAPGVVRGPARSRSGPPRVHR
jgi:transposase